jgi:putative ABC transport system permease protein
MEKLFGIPISQVTLSLVVVFALGVVLMMVVGLRNRVMFKMAVRNIPRRRAQSTLIVVGLMLATLLFSASFATGDTLAHSIRVEVLSQVGHVDERIQSDLRKASSTK